MQSCLGCPQVRRCRCPNQKTIKKKSMSTFHRPTSIDFRQNASFSVHNAVQMSKNSHTHPRNRMFYAEKLTRTVQNLTNCYFYTEPTGTLSTKNVQKTKNRKYRPNCFKKLYWVLKRVLSTKNGKGQACRFATRDSENSNTFAID